MPVYCLAALLMISSVPGCSRKSEPAPTAAAATPAAPAPGSTDWYKARAPAAVNALDRTAGWLDGLHLDPFALRAKGLNGRKQLVALLDAWRWLYLVAEGPRKEAIAARIAKVVAPVAEARFHDLATTDDVTFKQVATSYLRCAFLMDKLGLDTTNYLAEIRKVQKRFDDHMPMRGHHQKLAMRSYYQHFGLTFPGGLITGRPKGSLITQRRPAVAIGLIDSYHLAHEVMAAYDFGDRPEATPYSAADLTYLETVLHMLMLHHIERKDPDILAELVFSAILIDRARLPSVPRAIEVMLAAQNANGSFGSYPRVEAKLGRLADFEVYVHTAMVVNHAITAAWRAAGVPLVLSGPGVSSHVPLAVAATGT